MTDKEKALSAIINSVALEQEAIAKLINAETNKLNTAIENLIESENPPSEQELEKLLQIQQSIGGIIEQITELENTLKEKAQLAIDAFPPPAPCPVPKPCPPCPMPPPPPKPCNCCVPSSCCSQRQRSCGCAFCPNICSIFSSFNSSCSCTKSNSCNNCNKGRC